jgi:alkanesulfonate monooxygenase SsuD/methylene tetrahydromethanopterin reductase-like flavin-dependent oxidoreductase (luciferase family)
MAMTFGIHIGHMGGPLDEMRKLWRFADEQGFDWFSVSDHFQESPPQGGDLDCYEGIATLTAAAMETKRVRLGSMVYCVVYRNPGLLAKSLTTIDHLSSGRVDCAIGAGWHDTEAKAFGFDFPRIGVREDMLEEYAQILRMLFDPEQRRGNFTGTHFTLENAPNNPKPLQPRIPIWIGGRGEKRTLRAAAKYADGWNAAYIGADEWKHKSQVLTQWCETEKRDPKNILRTVNLGFYLGADAKGAARGEQIYQRHWGGRSDGREQRTGWLRGTPKDVMEMVGQFRDLGCARLNIAFREGPYDWDALHAFAEQVMPAFGVKKPR